jgi:acyl-CoA synthetase (AMP-forming)/AMP-acid ligase II
VNIVELLAGQASRRGHAVALVAPGRSLTFAALARESAAWARTLHAAGLRAGDIALFLHPMSVELYVALAAALRLGVTATFVDPTAGRDRIEAGCAARPPRGLIASPWAHALRLRSAALRHIPLKFSVGRRVPGATPLAIAATTAPRDAIEALPAEAPALVSFTTGTTGEPKTVVRTHGFLAAQHRALERALELEPGDLYLTALPLFVLANLASGAASLLPDADLRRIGLIDPEPVEAQIRRHAPTGAIAPPAFYERLVGRGGAPSLRRVYTGGAPVYPELLDRLQAWAPHAAIRAVYGSTEAEPMARLGREEISEDDRRAIRAGRGLLVGPPVEGLEVRVRPDPGSAVGEIVVRGPHVVSPGWHPTGDAGWLDARGRLWLMGRCAARIADARGVVYPLSVEARAQGHASVRRAALARHRDRRVLAVELYPDARAGEVREQLRTLEVDDVRVLDRIPVDLRHQSKIDYAALGRVLERRA